VLFPKSPQVKFNVFAIKVVYPNALSRTFTLVNFENQTLFEQIRDKSQKAWNDGSAKAVRNDRNKLENPKIIAEVKGTFNEVDPGQANPQVMIKNLEDLTFSNNSP
jgi:hypothetical protein